MKSFSFTLENVTSYIDGLDEEEDFCLGNLLTVYGIYNLNTTVSSSSAKMLIFHAMSNISSFLSNVGSFYDPKTINDVQKLAIYSKSVVNNVCVPNSQINNGLEINPKYRVFLEHGAFVQPLTNKAAPSQAKKGVSFI